VSTPADVRDDLGGLVATVRRAPHRAARGRSGLWISGRKRCRHPSVWPGCFGLMTQTSGFRRAERRRDSPAPWVLSRGRSQANYRALLLPQLRRTAGARLSSQRSRDALQVLASYGLVMLTPSVVVARAPGCSRSTGRSRSRRPLYGRRVDANCGRGRPTMASAGRRAPITGRCAERRHPSGARP
jgi:hypothetical protein